MTAGGEVLKSELATRLGLSAIAGLSKLAEDQKAAVVPEGSNPNSGPLAEVPMVMRSGATDGRNASH